MKWFRHQNLCLKSIVRFNGPNLFFSTVALRALADVSIDIISCYADLTPFSSATSWNLTASYQLQSWKKTFFFSFKYQTFINAQNPPHNLAARQKRTGKEKPRLSKSWQTSNCSNLDAVGYYFFSSLLLVPRFVLIWKGEK